MTLLRRLLRWLDPGPVDPRCPYHAARARHHIPRKGF